jgi:4-oxalocrotonate tautomerase
MPFVNIRTARGLLSSAQKDRLHAEVTDLLVRIEGNGDEAFRPFVTVLIEEHEPGCWSVGGNQVAKLLEDLK